MEGKSEDTAEIIGSESNTRLTVSGHSPPTKLLAKLNINDADWGSACNSDGLQNNILSDSDIDIQMKFQRLMAESSLDLHPFSNDSSIGDLVSSSLLSERNNPTSHTGQHSRNSLSVSSVQNDELGKLFKKFGSQEFLPAENVLANQEADKSLSKLYAGGIIPSENISTFSGFYDEAEIHISSNSLGKYKLSAEEFFKLKTDAIGSLQPDCSNSERPNFGAPLSSPEKRTRVALVSSFEESSVNSEKLTEPPQNAARIRSSNINVPATVTTCEQSVASVDCSTLNTTDIQHILDEHLLNSTSYLADQLIHNKHTFLKNPIPKNSLEDNKSTSIDESRSILSQIFDDEIQIKHPQEFETFLGSKLTASIEVKNVGPRWLKCSVVVEKVMEKFNLDRKPLPLVEAPGDVIIGSNERVTLTVGSIPQIAGNFVIWISINFEDPVTKVVQRKETFFEIICRIPKFEMKVRGMTVNELDFGSIPEKCIERVHAQLFYASNPVCALSLKLEVEEVSSTSKNFFLAKSNTEICNSLSHSYKAGGAKLMHFDGVFKAPACKDGINSDDDYDDNSLQSYLAYLNVSIEVSGGKPCLVQKLKLSANVGCPKLILNFSSPVVLYTTGVGMSDSKTLELKNDGIIPLRVEVIALNSIKKDVEPEGAILIQRGTMTIEPGQEGTFDVVFVPSWTFQDKLKRKIMVRIQPGGQRFLFEVIGKMKSKYPHHVATFSDSESSTKSVKYSTTQISTTHKQLVWSTVPWGKSETLSCRLRNDWHHSVKIILSLVDSTRSYKLLNEHGESVNSRKVKLHSKESTTFSVTFCPAQPGPAYAKITVWEPKKVPDASERFFIPLYGYGGTFKLIIKDVSKDMNGRMWLNLGQIDNSMCTQFTLYNKGNLDAFMYIKYIPSGVGTLLQKTDIQISPSQTIVPSGVAENIRVNFKLDHEDVAFILEDNKEVMQIGVLSLICGDEPTRQRIRRIGGKKLAHSQKSPILDLDELCAVFPGENCIPGLEKLDDPESHLRFLYRTFQQHEIALTVEKIGDRSLAMHTCIGTSESNSVIFKSMFEDNASGEHASENLSQWMVTPSSLTLLVPCYANGCITIGSSYKEDQPFEVACPVDFLTIEPQWGIVPSMGETVVVVTCDANRFKLNPSPKTLLKVYLENDVKAVSVTMKKMEEVTVGQMAAMHGREVSLSEEESLSSQNELNSVKKLKVKVRNSGNTIPTSSRTPTFKPGYIEPSVASLLPLHYDIVFPATTVGTSVTYDFKIENVKLQSLRLEVLIDKPFAVLESSLFIKGRSSAVIKLTFSPTAGGKFQQCLIISIEGQVEQQIYQVTGEGI